MPGIQRGERILKYNLHLPPQPFHLRALEMGNILTGITNVTVRRLDQLEDCLTGGCLTASAFTHQTQGLTFHHPEADAVHRMNIPPNPGQKTAPDRKVFDEPVDFQQCFCQRFFLNSCFPAADQMTFVD